MVHSMPPIVVKTLEMEWCVSGGTQFHADITQINKKKKIKSSGHRGHNKYTGNRGQATANGTPRPNPHVKSPCHPLQCGVLAAEPLTLPQMWSTRWCEHQEIQRC